MKSVKNNAEERIRRELLLSQESLFIKKENPKLLNLLLGSHPKMEVAFVLNWIPEQGEDIYEILIEKNSVIVVDLPKDDSAPTISKAFSVDEYSSSFKSRQKKVKLSIAIELIQSKII